MGTQVEKLHDAVRHNDRSCVERLVADGVSVNGIYYGMTPLLVAITTGNTDTAVWLMEHGADSNICDVNGTSAYEEAVKGDQVQVVKHLIRRGAEVNAVLRSGQTALTHAAEKKLTYLAQTLIAGGSDVNLPNSRGETPLYISAREGHSGVVELLLKAGVDTDVACGAELTTPLMACVMNEHLRTVNLLIQGGCGLNAQDQGGWTALWHAVSDSSEPLVRALVSAGADVFIPDSDGMTVLEVAAENDMDDIMNILKNCRR